MSSSKRDGKESPVTIHAPLSFIYFMRRFAESLDPLWLISVSILSSSLSAAAIVLNGKVKWFDRGQRVVVAISTPGFQWPSVRTATMCFTAMTTFPMRMLILRVEEWVVCHNTQGY